MILKFVFIMVAIATMYNLSMPGVQEPPCEGLLSEGVATVQDSQPGAMRPRPYDVVNNAKPTNINSARISA